LKNYFVLERLPVKFATKLVQEIFDLLISVLTAGEAIGTESKNHQKYAKIKISSN
jgi:hypothetical protein